MTKDVWVFVRSGSFREGWEVVGVYDATQTPAQIRPEYEWFNDKPDQWSAHDSGSAEYERTFLSDIYALRKAINV